MDVDEPEQLPAKPSPIGAIFRPPSPNHSHSYENIKRASLSSQVSSRRSSNTSRRRRIENHRKSDASSYGDRRGSHPPLNFRPVDHPPGGLPQASTLPSYDPHIYDQLSTYTFGDPLSASSKRASGPGATNGAGTFHSKSADETDESMEELDEEEQLQAERTKLRAMDDGSRRPSLPINIPPGSERRRSTVFRIANGLESMQMDDVPEERPNDSLSLPARLEPKPLPTLPRATIRDLPAPSPFQQLPPQDLRSRLEASAAAGRFDLNYTSEPEPSIADSPRMDSEASGASPPPNHASDARESSPAGGYQDSAGYQAILDHEWGTAFHIPANMSPRSSIIEDPFLQMVDHLDPVFNRNRYIWTFKKLPSAKKQALRTGASSSRPEPMSNGPSEDSTMALGDSEKSPQKDHTEVVMWNCQNVGQYGVWPGRSTPNGEHRRPSVLYAVSGEGSKRRGPTYLIHKHSRCHAFSIFQGYQVTGQKILAAHAMLLSNKAIQYSFANSPEHKSNSRTQKPHEPYEDDPEVQKLQTHHLVDDDSETPTTRTSFQQQQAPPQHDRGEIIHAAQAGSPKQIPRRHSTPDPPLPQQGSSDLLRHHTPRAGPSSFAAGVEMPKPELEGHVEPEASAASTSTLTPLPRVTPHAVAFDAVNPMDSTMTSQQVLNRASSTRFEWFRRAFGTGKAVGTAPRYSQVGPPAAAGDSVYSPPWLLMAPQSVKQEEERMLQNLNDSFRAVGLIPHPKVRPPAAGPRPKRPKPRSPIIDSIPKNAMMMLMPLWIAEGGNAGGVSKHHVPMTERTYLLVYYVPFDSSSRSGMGSGASGAGKKRTRRDRDRADRKKSMVVTASESALLSPTEEEFTTPVEVPTKPTKKKKTTFRVVARMLNYADVRECGIKLPRFGLAVHGSLSDALLGNPIYHAMGDDYSAVVAICHGEEAGVELITEGLDKLGLRKSKGELAEEQQIALAAMRADEGAMEEEHEARQQPLTPIGKSVVEMIFAGCVSILDVGFR